MIADHVRQQSCGDPPCLGGSVHGPPVDRQARREPVRQQIEQRAILCGREPLVAFRKAGVAGEKLGQKRAAHPNPCGTRLADFRRDLMTRAAMQKAERGFQHDRMISHAARRCRPEDRASKQPGRWLFGPRDYHRQPSAGETDLRPFARRGTVAALARTAGPEANPAKHIPMPRAARPVTRECRRVIIGSSGAESEGLGISLKDTA
jgi:hypothetical protein